MSGVAGRFGPLGKRLGGVLGGIGKALTGPLGITLGASAAATAFGAFARSAINAADELGKAATRTGVSVEALSSLEVAARQGGTSIADLETGLAAMAKRALDSTRGLASAGRGFDALGVSVTDSSGAIKDTEVLYGELADAFAMLEDGATKNALAQDVFGRSGKNLVPVLNQTSRALSNNVTTSEEFARTSEAINDRLDDLRVIGQRVGNAVLTNLLPPLLSLVEATLAGARALGERLKPAWDLISEAFQSVLPVLTTVVRTYFQLGQVIRRTLWPILVGLVKDVLRPVFGAFTSIWRAVRQLLPSGARLASWGRSIVGTFKNIAATVLQSVGLLRQFGSVARNIATRQFGNIASDWRQIGEETRAAVENVRAVGTATVEVTQEIDLAEQAAEGLTLQFDATGSSIGGAISEVGNLKTAVEEVGAVQRRLDEERLAREQGIQQVRVVTIDQEIAKGMQAHVVRVQQISSSETARREAEERLHQEELDNIKAREQREADAIKALEEERQRGLRAFRDDIRDAVAGLLQGTRSWGEALQGILNGVMNRIVQKIAGNVADSILNAWTASTNHAGGLFSNLLKGLTSGFGNFFQFMGKGFASVLGGAARAIQGIVNSVSSIFGGIRSGISGITSAIGNITRGIGGLVRGALGALNGVGNVAPIINPAGGILSAGGAGAGAAGGLAGLGPAGALGLLAAPVALFGFLGRHRVSESDRQASRAQQLLQEARTNQLVGLGREFQGSELSDLGELRRLSSFNIGQAFSRSRSSTSARSASTDFRRFDDSSQGRNALNALRESGLYSEFSRLRDDAGRQVSESERAGLRSVVELAQEYQRRLRFSALTDQEYQAFGGRNTFNIQVDATGNQDPDAIARSLRTQIQEILLEQRGPNGLIPS